MAQAILLRMLAPELRQDCKIEDEVVPNCFLPSVAQGSSSLRCDHGQVYTLPDWASYNPPHQSLAHPLYLHQAQLALSRDGHDRQVPSYITDNQQQILKHPSTAPIPTEASLLQPPVPECSQDRPQKRLCLQVGEALPHGSGHTTAEVLQLQQFAQFAQLLQLSRQAAASAQIRILEGSGTPDQILLPPATGSVASNCNNPLQLSPSKPSPQHYQPPHQPSSPVHIDTYESRDVAHRMQVPRTHPPQELSDSSQQLLRSPGVGAGAAFGIDDDVDTEADVNRVAALLILLRHHGDAAVHHNSGGTAGGGGGTGPSTGVAASGSDNDEDDMVGQAAVVALGARELFMEAPLADTDILELQVESDMVDLGDGMFVTPSTAGPGIMFRPARVSAESTAAGGAEL